MSLQMLQHSLHQFSHAEPEDGHDTRVSFLRGGRAGRCGNELGLVRGEGRLPTLSNWTTATSTSFQQYHPLRRHERASTKAVKIDTRCHGIALITLSAPHYAVATGWAPGIVHERPHESTPDIEYL